MHLVSYLASFAAGALGAMGFGSGTVLLLYLTLGLQLDQQTAQGINLLFFLPCGALALCVYAVRGALPLKRAAALLLCALPGVALGYGLLRWLPVLLLRRVFGGFLVVLAVQTLFRSFAGRGSKKSKQ